LRTLYTILLFGLDFLDYIPYELQIIFIVHRNLRFA
jgi:hypothetical protein